jgi:hypothetical protein
MTFMLTCTLWELLRPQHAVDTELSSQGRSVSPLYESLYHPVGSQAVSAAHHVSSDV